MTLKWVSALIATAAFSAFGTVNAVTSWTSDSSAPGPLNLILVATCTGGVVLTVVAELYRRIDSRLSAIADFLVTRLDELDDRLHGHDRSTIVAANDHAQRGPDPLVARAVAPLGGPRGPKLSGQRRSGHGPTT